MKLLFEISGEHPSLPTAEVAACLKRYGVHPRSSGEQHVLLVDAEIDLSDIQAIGHRLALSHAVYEVLSYGSPEKVEQSVATLDFADASTFSLQGRRFGTSPGISTLKQRLGDRIRRETGLSVDLVAPDITLFIISDIQIYLCRRLVLVDRSQFELRKPQHRPFSSPVSLHPRTARALVNLTGLANGQTLMDPFCGTGGILIEAGLLGAQVIGIDIKKAMVEGCRANLAHYGITPFALHQGDATTIKGLLPVDVVVTDLPYGRSTSVTAARAILYREALSSMSDWLKPGGTAVVGLPEERFVSLAHELSSVEAVHPMRVHRSLTRYFCVLRPD